MAARLVPPLVRYEKECSAYRGTQRASYAGIKSPLVKKEEGYIACKETQGASPVGITSRAVKTQGAAHACGLLHQLVDPWSNPFCRWKGAEAGRHAPILSHSHQAITLSCKSAHGGRAQEVHSERYRPVDECYIGGYSFNPAGRTLLQLWTCYPWGALRKKQIHALTKLPNTGALYQKQSRDMAGCA